MTMYPDSHVPPATIEAIDDDMLRQLIDLSNAVQAGGTMSKAEATMLLACMGPVFKECLDHRLRAAQGLELEEDVAVLGGNVVPLLGPGDRA